MSIIFFGTPSFAVPSLEALLRSGEDIPLAVTQPDRPGGRGHKLIPPAVKEFALSKNISVIQPFKMRDPEFHDRLRSLDPEFMVVAAYGRILPKEVLDIPSGGCINVHGSLLPKYRGAAPIQRALLAGESITGVTIMKMDEGLDTGDIILAKEISIDDADTSQTLFERLASLGADALVEALGGLRSGRLKPHPQQGEPSYAPPLCKDEGRIDWSKSSRQIFNLVRGMHPWPSAFTFLGDERLKILKASLAEGSGAAGVIESISGGRLLAGTGSGLICIEELQPAGKGPMQAKAFIAGRKIREKHDKFS
ncbi:MAG: methionyl-tRNA formyltransferase [Nitrospiraceae bacterium]|nr:methionyl-tRNA formyltransferase [Nitrospiraceae bacterium]